MRCSKELTAGAAEEREFKVNFKISQKTNYFFEFFKKFLFFLRQFEVLKTEYQRLFDEARKMQGQLDDKTHWVIVLDRKLMYAQFLQKIISISRLYNWILLFLTS